MRKKTTLILIILLIIAIPICTACRRSSDRQGVVDTGAVIIDEGTSENAVKEPNEVNKANEDKETDIPEIKNTDKIMRGDEMPPPDVGSYTGVVPIWYFQFDERWSDDKYNDGTTKDTLRGWACGPADMAMVVSTLKDDSVTPADATKWSLKHGYYTSARGKTEDGFFTEYGKEWGINVHRVLSGDLREMKKTDAKKYHDEAESAVRNGDWAIVFMGKGPWTTEGHFVLWYGMDGDNVLIRDSNSKKPAKAKNKLALMQETVIRYWIVDVPKE